jgi:hypothetical protein
MQCTQCQSDNVQSLRVIYESGTQKIKTSSRTCGGGGGFGGGGLRAGLGSANTTTTGTQQTALAKKVSPPNKKSFIPSIVIAGLAIAFTAMFSMPVFILLIAIAVAAFLGYRAFKYNKEQYPPLYDTWSRSWHCNKCGNIYSVQ